MLSPTELLGKYTLLDLIVSSSLYILNSPNDYKLLDISESPIKDKSRGS
jgi:hypothetical protein